VVTELLDLLTAAAAGRFPPADARVDVIGSPPGPSDAVVAFTAHHVVAADVPAAHVLAQLDPNDIGAPMGARFLAWLADQIRSEPGMLDAVLVADPAPRSEMVKLASRDDLAEHPRVARAIQYRTGVRVFADPEERGVLALGRGLAGRLEVSLEIESDHRGHGLGRAMAAAARSLSDGEPVFAQVSPGNVSSLRAFLAAGYRPIASEVLFLKPAAQPTSRS
jgi:GNAT superfamily N-acetyltransferase